MAQGSTVVTARRLFLALAVLLAIAAGSACATSSTAARDIPPGVSDPDQFLFDKGKEALDKKRWIPAREYFKRLNENYTQSPLRPEAKLAIGDTYIGEGTTEGLLLAINEFQEFLAFYPTHPRCDYAQYRLAMAHMKQMRAPQRDQTETRDAVKALDEFVLRYPNSTLMPEATQKLREAKDRLSEADFLIGRFYYRQVWYPGAIARLQSVLKDDPEYTGRDGVYFYLGEALLKVNRPAEALPYFERLVKEFEKSEYLDEAQKRIATLSARADTKPT
jgi:outer membrane protein assembly factor BamD